MEMEVPMVAESSGIKDKGRLRAYLYKNPTKLALKLAQFIKDSNGNINKKLLKAMQDHCQKNQIK